MRQSPFLYPKNWSEGMQLYPLQGCSLTECPLFRRTSLIGFTERSIWNGSGAMETEEATKPYSPSSECQNPGSASTRLRFPSSLHLLLNVDPELESNTTVWQALSSVLKAHKGMRLSSRQPRVHSNWRIVVQSGKNSEKGTYASNHTSEHCAERPRTVWKERVFRQGLRGRDI